MHANAWIRAGGARKKALRQKLAPEKDLPTAKLSGGRTMAKMMRINAEGD